MGSSDSIRGDDGPRMEAPWEMLMYFGLRQCTIVPYVFGQLTLIDLIVDGYQVQEEWKSGSEHVLA